MGNNENESTRYPTWKWVLMLAITIIAFLSVKGITTTEARIDAKLDKSIYEADKARCNEDIKEIKESILQMRIELMRNTQIASDLQMALIIHDPKVAKYIKDRK